MKKFKIMVYLFISLALVISSMAIVPLTVSADTYTKVLHDGFETASSISNTYFWSPIPAGGISFPTGSSAITPSKSLRLSQGTAGAWDTVFGLDTGKFSLAASTAYTIAFKYKMNTTGNAFQIQIVESNGYTTTAWQRFNADTTADLTGAGMTYQHYSYSSFNYVQFKFTTAAAAGKFSYFTFIRANSTAAFDITIDDFSIYQGDVPSWDMPQSTQIVNDGFEAASAISDTKFWTPLAGVTFPSTETITGSKSLRFVEGTNANGYSTVFGQDTTKLKLVANTTYTIGFKYKMATTGNQFQLAITEENTWLTYAYGRFDADSANATNGTGVTYYKTTSANYNYVQFKFTTPNSGNNSYFTFQRADDTTAFDITVDDFTVNEGVDPSRIANELFEDGMGQVSRTPSWIDSDKPFVMNRTFLSPNVLDGSASVFGGVTTLADNWDEMMNIPTSSVAIDINTVYTIQFRYKILENTGNFFYVALVNSDNAKTVTFRFDENGADSSNTAEVVGYSIVDEGNGVKLATASLLTKGAGSYTKTAFAYKGGGKIVFDDISIYKGMNTFTYPAAQINISNPDLDSGVNFEDGTDSLNFWTQTGTGFTGQVSTDTVSLISGARSFAIRSTAAFSEELLYDFVHKPLDPATRYTISFKYKPFTDISYPNTADTRFYFIAESATLTWTANIYQSFTVDGKSVLLLNSAPWYNGIEDFVIQSAGDYYNAYITFTTQNASDVRFKFGIANGGAYALDDIKVSKGFGESSQPILNSSKAMTSFDFNSFSPVVAASIDGTDITATVPAGSDITNLVATFTSSPTSTTKIGLVNQISGTTANNFTNPVVYTVTAEDGSTTNYTVTVTVEQAVVFNGFNVSNDPEKYVTGVSPNMSLTSFLQNIILGTNVAYTAKNISDQTLSASDLVGTGAQLNVYYPDSSLFATYTIVIYGDTDGNGLINISDLAAIKNHLLHSYTLTGVSAKAGNIYQKASITISDLLAVKKHILNITLISQ